MTWRRAIWPGTGGCRAKLLALAWGLAAGSGALGAEIRLQDLHGVFPDAERVGPTEGVPPAASVYRKGRLAGYAFHSAAVVGVAGYSGKPIDILIGLDLDGVITGLRLIEHHEPILALGIPESVLRRFIDHHRGLDVRSPGSPARRGDGRSAPIVDTISGATVSAIVINDSIFRSARAVARSRGLLGAPTPRSLDLDTFESATWSALLADGSIAHRRVVRSDASPGVEREGGAGKPSPPLLIDLFVALLNPPRIGRNLLGDRLFAQVFAGLGAGDAAILIAANGLYSFKGTAFTRTGAFDRIQVVQDERVFRLRTEQHRRIDALSRAVDAPEFREIGLFTLQAASGFDPTKAWRLELAVTQPDQAGMSVQVPYRLPDRYFQRAPDPPGEPAQAARTDPGSRTSLADADPPRAQRPQPERPAPPWTADLVRAGLVALTALIALFVAGLALARR